MRNAMHSADYDVARCLSVCMSVCPSVRPSHAGILSNRGLNISSNFFSPSGSHVILVVFTPNGIAIFRRGPLNGGVECTAGGTKKNRDFRPIYRFVSELIQDRAIVTMADW